MKRAGSARRRKKLTRADYQRFGDELVKSVGLERPTGIRKTLTGLGGRTKHTGKVILEAPWPTTTRRRLYVLAHEVGHIKLQHCYRKLPSYLEEFEAEQWAHKWLRRRGIPVPKASTAEARDYVAQAALKSLDPRVVKWAGLGIRSDA